MTDTKLTNILIYTNPITYVLIIIALVWIFVENILGWTGILDWYTIIFKFKNIHLEDRKYIVERLKADPSWKFFLKRAAENWFIKRVENDTAGDNE